VKRGILLLVAWFFLGGCAPVLTNDGQQVRIISRLNQPKNCEVLAVLSSRRNEQQMGAAGATMDIRNEAAGIGANSIFIISSTANEFGVVTITAEALRCG